MSKISVIDFGGQYAHLIANRFRRLGVYSEVLPADTSLESLRESGGIVLSGGPDSVYNPDAPRCLPEVLDLPVPILGICYGHQLLCQMLGGNIHRGKIQEYGVAQLSLHESPLFQGIPQNSVVWMSHGDEVQNLPTGFSVIGSTANCNHAAVANPKSKRYGIQFHPEVTHTEFGVKVFQNFLDICELKKNWDMSKYFQHLEKEIQSQCKDKNVFLLVSGGVDSTVAFALLNKILGPERVLGLHIDNGLMRKGECQQIIEYMRREGFSNLEFYDATQEFMSPLEGIVSPETKRKIIGDTFFQVLESQLKRLHLPPEKWLWAQGTTYPDTIESGGTKNAATIKTHHNRVPMAIELLKKGLIIEPLAELYKDEVRELGLHLGVPDELIWRHPFPGPGLGVRYLCQASTEQDSAEKLKFESTMAEISQEFQEPTQAKYRETISHFQILPIKSVGVQGDARTYAHPLLIEGKLNWKIFEDFSTQITNRYPLINRVVWQINRVSNDPYLPINQSLNKADLDFLREIDAICTEGLFEFKLYRDVWQMPVVFTPLRVQNKPVVILRPIHSSEAMTANFAQMPEDYLNQVWEKGKKAGLGALLFDLTHKPPGTIEWE